MVTQIEYPEDCIAIRDALLTTGHVHWEVTLAEAQEFWEWRSCEWCAGWLVLEKPEAIRDWFVQWLEVKKIRNV